MASNPQSSGAQPLWPPVIGSAGPPQNFSPAVNMQFHPPQQQAHPFLQPASQQFRPVGQGISIPNVGIPPQGQQIRFPHLGQPLPPKPGQTGYGPPLSQAIPTPYVQPSLSLPPQQNSQPLNNHMPNSSGGIGTDVASSYNFPPPSYGQPQNNMNGSSQYQPISQSYASVTPVSGPPSLQPGGQNTFVTLQNPGQQPSVPAADGLATTVKPPTMQSSSDWLEHTSVEGRRYYYNKKTRQSFWEKPLELMTPIERADASTSWQEFTSPDGRKYYYNKVTKISKWVLPDELKLAREQAKNVASQDIPSEIAVASQAPVFVSVSTVDTQSAGPAASSPVPVIPISSVVNPPSVVSGSPSVHVPSTAPSNVNGVCSPVAVVPTVSASGNTGVFAVEIPATTTNILENVSQPVETSSDVSSLQNLEEAKKGTTQEKVVEAESFTYSSKQEAKDAFKALLTSVNVESDWTWEQAMRLIINDKRYGALRTLGERKQAFNEYLSERKKQEAEERRIRLKKAREDFTKMLEESKDLTSSTRWSKAVTIFEDDERFKAVERTRDREDLYESYLAELKKKEKAKAHEEHKKNRMEYKLFLQSCDFIKANSQWRKVQKQLEDDERCLRLDKIERLEIFQEYITDLEKEEEEQRKIQKEQLRRAERNNRDDFRKLMEGHVSDGILTAKIHWRDYCMQVKDLPAYMAVSANTSGATAKDLFEDVAEDLVKQYREDKTRIKDAMKLGKIAMTSSWTFDDFKAAIWEDIGSSPISDINLKLFFDDLLEKIKEKEEKEAKKRLILSDDFSRLLLSIKELNEYSNWEDSKPLLEDSQEYRSIEEESFKKDIFEGYITVLHEKAVEKERKRAEEKAKKEKERAEKEKRKERERKEKERERGRDKGVERYNKQDEIEIEKVDGKEPRKKEKEKDRKHRRRHHSDASSEKDDKDDSKRSHRHRSEKSRKHLHAHESDTETRHKRHKRGHRPDSYGNGGYDNLEDGEFGEDEVKR